MAVTLQAQSPAVRLMTLDPGHFHAGLIQKEMYPGVSEVVHVYAPLGPDLTAHLNRIAGFNLRRDNPTRWQLEIHTSNDPLERMLRDKPGNVVVLSGRNQIKIDRILASVKAGLHVLADKPWIISPADLPKLEEALSVAETNGVAAYDIMTERFEITTILQKALVNDPAVIGVVVKGTPDAPGVFMESVHYLMKTVAGVPNLRPAWFFDINQQGEALADVGTHLVDLVPWILFPDQAVDHRKDIQLHAAKRWPTMMTRAEFERVTGGSGFPDFLTTNLKEERLEYFSNTDVSYAVRGVHTRLKVLWGYEAAPGAGDTHFAVVRGTKARIEVRQGAEQKYRPELFVVPVQGADLRAAGASASQAPGELLSAVKSRVAALQSTFPGVAVEQAGADIHIVIPDNYRTGHEAHFAEVTRKFLEYLRAPKTVPAWERPNMLAKYYVTTKGVELSRRKS
jgi:predicted dehydrogenase